MYPKPFIVLLVVLSLLIGGSYLHAAWTPPSTNPPTGTVASALNASGATQLKIGDLLANIFGASTEMRSDKYCDSNGGNCLQPGVTLPVCAQGQTLVAAAGGQWLCQ